MLVARFAFHLFGSHIGAIVATMLMLMGVSALAFLYRFRDGRAAVVILYFTALSAMLLTPLVTVPSYVANIPVGGIRYFCVVAILPAFHLLFEITDAQRPDARASSLVPVAIQVVVLLIAILVRNSAATLMGALAAALLLCLWRVRRDRGAALGLLFRAAAMAAIGTVFIGLLLVSFSRGYLHQGRFTETIWHRIFVSLGTKAGFPYGNVREMFDCRKYIPEGIVPGTEDRNGHCVWLAHATKHNVPLSEGFYGRKYDAALREGFFAILLAYPAEVIDTFTAAKTRYLTASLAESLRFNLAAFSPGAVCLLIAALANLLAYAFLRPRTAGSSATTTVAGATALFAAFCLLPYYAVWAAPYTIGELLVYSFFVPGLLALAGIGALRRALTGAPAAGEVPAPGAVRTASGLYP